MHTTPGLDPSEVDSDAYDPGLGSVRGRPPMHATPDLDPSEVDLRCMRPLAWIPPTSIVVRRRELAATLARAD
jgi:hypothetical protein